MWKDFYKNTEEEILINIPEPREKEILMYYFVNASYALNKVNTEVANRDIDFCKLCTNHVLHTVKDKI